MKKTFVMAALFMVWTSAFAAEVDNCKSNVEAWGNATLEMKAKEQSKADKYNGVYASEINPTLTTQGSDGSYLMKGTIFNTEYHVRAILNEAGGCSVKSVTVGEWSEKI